MTLWGKTRLTEPVFSAWRIWMYIWRSFIATVCGLLLFAVSSAIWYSIYFQLSYLLHSMFDSFHSGIIFNWPHNLYLKVHIFVCNSVFRLVRKSIKSGCWLRHVYQTIHKEQIGSNLTDFHEIWYLSIFRKSVKKIQV